MSHGSPDSHVRRVMQLSKEGAWIVVGQVVSLLGSLVLVRVLTEYLPPRDYGELALGLTIALLVHQAIMGGISGGLGRFYSVAVEEGDVKGYIESARTLVFRSILAVALFALVLTISLFGTGGDRWMAFVWAFLVLAILNGVNSSLNWMQNAGRQRAIVALHSGLVAWLKIGLALVFISLFGATSLAVVCGYVAATAVVIVSQACFLMHIINKPVGQLLQRTSRNWTREIWRYSWPISAWGIFTWAQQVSDRWALQYFSTTENVGVYAVLYQLGCAPVILVSSAAMAFIVPILYQRSGGAQDRRNNLATRRLGSRIMIGGFAATGLAFLGALAMHEEIFLILVSSSYRFASPWLPWMVLAGGLFACGQVLAYMMQVEMRTRESLPVKIWTAVLGVIAAFAGAAMFGIAGVIGAQLAFSVVFLLAMNYVYRRRVVGGD